MKLRSLILKIRRECQRNRALILRNSEWDHPELAPIKHETDRIQFLATKAGVEWLIEYETGTAHFYL